MSNLVDHFKAKSHALKSEIQKLTNNLNKLVSNYDELTITVDGAFTDNNKKKLNAISNIIDKVILLNHDMDSLNSQIDDITYAIDNAIVDPDETVIKRIKDYEEIKKMWKAFLPSMMLYKMLFKEHNNI